MSLDRWIAQNVVYRGATVLRGEGGVFRYLDELRKLEGGAAGLDMRQRLNSILQYARGHCPFYARRISSTDLSYADPCDYMRSIPLLEKSDLRLHREALKASPLPRRVRRKTTGGSTGEAVTVLKNPDATAREMAASWLAYEWFGVRIGDRAVRFWGDPFSMKRKLRFFAADLATHRIRFSAFAFDDADLEEYWERCRRFRPDYFYGYVSMIVGFARFLRDRLIDGRTLGLKSVICTSEVLQESERKFLEESFGCPVQNEYGCGEVGPIAYSCPEGRLHVMNSNVHLEIVGDDDQPLGPGKNGQIVITDLNNRAMPLIRYRIGDRGVMSEEHCPCGRPYPVLKKIWGRAYDFIHSPGGKRYHGEFFMYLFEEMRDRGLDFERFRVTQIASNRLLVQILAARPDAKLEWLVRERLLEEVPEMQLDLAWVDDIPRAPSGKMRIIVNEVAEAPSSASSQHI